MCVCVYLHNHDPADFISFVCLSKLHQQQADKFKAFFATPTCQQIQGWNEGLFF
jgi:hypothetical protein